MAGRKLSLNLLDLLRENWKSWVIYKQCVLQTYKVVI